MSVFSLSVSRNISDKLYERRKLAALEIESLVQRLASRGQLDQVYELVDNLAVTYALSSHQHARKGGLLCLAAAAVGLAASGDDAVQHEAFLRRAVPPILASFTDQDSRVRYYALEALYNVAKSARPGILSLFPEIFDALLRLCGDADVSVQNATAFTAALIKDCLAESPAFNFGEFVPTLEASLAVDTSGKRQFLLGWLSLLDSLPAADQCLLRALPRLLPGILSMVDDPAPEVRQAADKLLRELAQEVRRTPGRTDVGAVAASLAAQLGAEGGGGGAALRRMALHWLSQLVDAAPEALAPQLPAVLHATLGCVDSGELEISRAASELDDKLLQSGALLEAADAAALMGVAAEGLGASQQVARLEALRWTRCLLQRDAPAALQQSEAMLVGLCDALSSASDVVVQETAVVLAMIAAHGAGYRAVLSAVLDCFRGPSGGKLLQRRGLVIVEKLCAELGSAGVLSTLSSLLADDEDAAFAAVLVQALNLILLTSAQLQGARSLLQRALQEEAGAELFQALFSSFSLSSGAAVSLAMLAQAYELACRMIGALAQAPLSAAMSVTVVEISQVVSLLEAPPFAAMRLQLLVPAERPALLRALYSMLLLLPQGEAFHTLQQRLSCVPTAGSIDGAHGANGRQKSGGGGGGGQSIDEQGLLDAFVHAQARRLHEG